MKYLVKFLFPVISCSLLLSCKGNEEQMWVSIRNNTDSPITCILSPKNPDQVARVDRAVIESNSSRDIAISDEVTKDPVSLFAQQYGDLKVELEDGTQLEFSSGSDPVRYTMNPFSSEDAWTLTIQEDTYSTNSNSTDVEIWNYEFIINNAHIIK